MKTHFDPMLKKQVMHGHDLEDISGIGSIASGNLGSLDASAGTLEVPIDPPESTKSGFWIITVAGYIDLDGVSTLFEAGDFLTFDLNSGDYARIDNKSLDATLDISSTFTNSLTGGLVNQKQVNERLDIYVPPAGSAAGSIPYWDGTKRVTSDPTKFKWDAVGETLTFGNSGVIKVGDCTLYRDVADVWKTNDAFISTVYVRSGEFRSDGNFALLNKAQSGWLTFATRNMAGAESVYDLGYVGNITMPYASIIKTTTGALTLATTNASKVYFAVNNITRWFLDEADGTFSPNTTNTSDIGSSSRLVKDLYLGGKIYVGSDCQLYRLGTNTLYTINDFQTLGYLETKAALYHGTNIYVKNKAGTGALAWFTRNTAGAEAVGDLTYVGNITSPYAVVWTNTTGNMTLGTTNGVLTLRGGGANWIQYYINGGTRWVMDSSTIYPQVDGGGSLGTSSYKFDKGYFSGTVFAGTLNVGTHTPASASATGVSGTIAWDSDFLYVCIAANTWKRAALSTW